MKTFTECLIFSNPYRLVFCTIEIFTHFSFFPVVKTEQVEDEVELALERVTSADSLALGELRFSILLF